MELELYNSKVLIPLFILKVFESTIINANNMEAELITA